MVGVDVGFIDVGLMKKWDELHASLMTELVEGVMSGQP